MKSQILLLHSTGDLELAVGSMNGNYSSLRMVELLQYLQWVAKAAVVVD